MAYGKVVHHGAIDGNRTLADLNGPVHVSGAILIHSMPVKASRLVSQLIVDIYYQPVAFGHTNSRKRPLAVDANDRAHKGAVWICKNPGDIEVVGNCCGEAGA